MKQKSIAARAAVAAAGLMLAFIFIGCEMEVADPMDPIPLVEPYITLQPASSSYYPGQYNASNPDHSTLTVEAADWEDRDGKLSYQWYTFTTIEDYVKGGVNVTELPGETEPTLAIDSLLNKTDGSRNYFYAVVTNTNSAANIGGTKAGVQSEVAVISFNATGNAAIPIITRRPSDAQARFGRSLNPPMVRIQTGINSANLSYKWIRVDFDANGEFTADANGIPQGTTMKEPVIVDGEEAEQEVNSPILNLSPGDLKLGDNYFFVAITHDDGIGTPVTEYSIPARIEILKGVRADAPVITVQPRAALYFSGDPVLALTVTAESTDFGDLSYQWYRHPGTTNSNKNGTRINNAAGASYMPDISANPNAYYYVVVTNTNPNVVGARTATAVSRPVNVRLTSASTSVTPNSTIQIGSLTDPTNRYNYIRGYGGMEVAWANFPETLPADTELQYDPDRLGFNILRIMMPVSNTNIDIAMDDLVNVTKRRPHYYDNVKIVNKYGGYVAAAPWSPPKEWKSNNSINGGGYLRTEYYKQYAAYLKAFAQHMYNRGAPIYCISIQNEPNYTAGYDGCEWTGAEMAAFFAQVGTFTEGVKGYGGGKQIPRVLTMNGESANNPDINHAAIDNANAYRHIDVFARHVYGERTQNLWSSRPNVQRVDGKEVWMTEHNINSANAAGYVLDSTWNFIWRYMNDVDLVMRLNNENAFVWWASKRFYSMIGDGQYGTPAGVALPRGWGLSHYAKYTIDTTRIGFSMSGTAVGGAAINIAMGDGRGSQVVNGTENDMDNISARITAYVSQDGNEISMVMWTPTLSSGDNGYNLGTIAIQMPAGFVIGSATAIQSYAETSTTNRFQIPYDVRVSQERDTAYVDLPRSRLMSVKFTRQPPQE
jgi:O-glycosyl hydrolase